MTAMDVPGHDHQGRPVTCADTQCQAALRRADTWIGPHLSVEADGRAHFHHTDALHASVRAARDADFLAVCGRFDADPTDFVTAWTYLSLHPIFWRPLLPATLCVSADQLDADGIHTASDPPTVDDTDGLRDMYMSVRTIGPATVVELEHGPHLWVSDVERRHWHQFPAQGQSAHDPRLDVTAGSYEDAIVALAARVRSVYGNNRAQVSTPAQP